MTGTFIFLMVCIIFLCVVLALLILSQNSKGGGLTSTFGGNAGSQMFGVQRTNQFMTKATWAISGSIVAIIAMASILMIPKESTIEVEAKTEKKPTSTPTGPTKTSGNTVKPVIPGK